MQAKLIFAVAALCALTFAAPAHAERHPEMIFRPHPTFENILPEGFTLTDAPAVDTANLRDKRVAVIPSENLNLYAAGWLYYFEHGGANPNWLARAIGGVTDDNINNQGRVSDPRRLTDSVVDLIRPYFGAVVVAQDLPSAREQGADYFLVLDCAMSNHGFWSQKVRFDGGVYLLDASLRRVFENTTSAEAPLVGLLDNPSTSVPAGVDRAMTTMLTQLSAGVRAHLAASQ